MQKMFYKTAASVNICSAMEQRPLQKRVGDIMLKEAPFNRDKKGLKENFILLTTDCNFKCPYCIEKDVHKKNYIKDEDFRKALDFSKEQGHTTIHLHGGEPTLHPNIVQYAKLAKNYGFFVEMATNFVNAERVKELDGILDLITISYGKQPFLPNPKEWKSKLILYTVIEKSLIPTLDELKKFIKKHKDEGFTVLFSTLNPVNQYSYDNQYVDYLEELFLQTPLYEIQFSTNKVGFMVDGCYVRMGNKKYQKTNKYNMTTQGKIRELFPRDLSTIVRNPELEKLLEEGNKKIEAIRDFVLQNNGKPIATKDFTGYNKTVLEIKIESEMPKSILNVGQIISQENHKNIGD